MPRCCALALAGVLLLSGCASAPGTAVWSGTRVDDADLPALLLTAAEVEEITGVELPDETVGDTYLIEGVPADCSWAWEPAVEDTYVNAAPTGVAHSVLYRLWETGAAGERTLAGPGPQVHQALVTVSTEAAPTHSLPHCRIRGPRARTPSSRRARGAGSPVSPPATSSVGWWWTKPDVPCPSLVPPCRPAPSASGR